MFFKKEITPFESGMFLQAAPSHLGFLPVQDDKGSVKYLITKLSLTLVGDLNMQGPTL